MVRELVEIGRCMDRETRAGRSVESIATKQSAQLEAKLCRIIDLTAHPAIELSDVFGMASSTAGQKSSFANKLAGVLGGAMTASYRRAQKIDIEQYMPPQLWDVLDDGNMDIALKSQHIANLFAALEATVANEPSVARAAVVLATIGLSNIAPSVDTLHTLHVHLNAAVKLTSHDRARVFSLTCSFTPRAPQTFPWIGWSTRSALCAPLAALWM